MLSFPSDAAEKQLLILDLGGVILDIDYGLTTKAFMDLGVTDFDHMYSQSAQSGLFDAIEIGTITPEEFRDGLREISGIPFTDEQIDEAWNAMLLKIPETRLELLRELSKLTRMVLFSNTNAIHLEHFQKIITKQYGHDVLDEVFETCHYSHIFGARKPEVETFTRLVEAEGVKPAEAFFIDDSPQHVEGARAAGIDALWLNTKKTSLEEVFSYKA